MYDLARPISVPIIIGDYEKSQYMKSELNARKLKTHECDHEAK